MEGFEFIYNKQIVYITIISNAMQYSNTALETTALIMYDPNTFFCGATFSHGSVKFINIYNIS